MNRLITATGSANRKKRRGAIVNATDQDLDWLARSTAPGVFRAFGFTTSSDIGPDGTLGGDPDWFYRPGALTSPTISTEQYCSGGSSMMFVYPSNSGQSACGDWRVQAGTAGDLNLFGEDSEFWVSYRMRWSSEMAAVLSTGQGVKMHGIEVGRAEPGYPDHSQNNPAGISGQTWQASNLPINYVQAIYHDDGAGLEATGSARFDTYYPPLPAPFEDYVFQNAYIGGPCYYANSIIAGQMATECWLIPYDEWVTYKLHVRIRKHRPAAPWNGNYWDVVFHLYAARAGEDFRMIHEWGPSHRAYGPISSGPDGDNVKLGKISLIPFITNKDAGVAHAPAKIWYDEFLWSTRDIAAPGFQRPYSLPAAGQAVACSANTFNSVKPAEWTTAQWNYSVFESFGGGTFVEQYSSYGAWVAAGTGGHGHPDNPGGIIFDFQDGLFKLVRPADADAAYAGSYTPSQTSGTPYYEINNAAGYPAPTHPYATLVPLPSSESESVGVKGGVMYVTRGAITTDSGVASPSVHGFDLNTGIWTRRTDATALRYSSEGDAIWDSLRRRYYLFTNGDHNYANLQYLDPADWTFKTINVGVGFPPTNWAAGRVMLLNNRYLVRHSAIDATKLCVVDLENLSTGVVQPTVSGTLPTSPLNRWSLWRGKFYSIGRNGGNQLNRITPPVDPMTGTWVVDTVTIDTSLPALPTGAGGTTEQYTCLFYVPSIDCLAWVSGGTNPVYIIHPE